MEIDSLTVGQLKEIKALIGKTTPKKEIRDGGIKIVVLQRGWVAVGRFSQSGQDCVLEKAAIIRDWGTTKGLPELVNGPISGKTVLDKTPLPLRFHELTVVLMLDASEDKWREHL